MTRLARHALGSYHGSVNKTLVMVAGFALVAGIMIGLPVASHECDLTLGYMVQGWWNIMDTRVDSFSLAGTGGGTGGNQYLHGPFLNIAMKW